MAPHPEHDPTIEGGWVISVGEAGPVERVLICRCDDDHDTWTVVLRFTAGQEHVVGTYPTRSAALDDALANMVEGHLSVLDLDLRHARRDLALTVPEWVDVPR